MRCLNMSDLLLLESILNDKDGDLLEQILNGTDQDLADLWPDAGAPFDGGVGIGGAVGGGGGDERLMGVECMKNPHEMLMPWIKNEYFNVTVASYAVTFLIGVLGNVVAMMGMISDRKVSPIVKMQFDVYPTALQTCYC